MKNDQLSFFIPSFDVTILDLLYKIPVLINAVS